MTEVLRWLASVAPIVLICVAITVWKLPTQRTAILGALAAAIAAFFIHGAGPRLILLEAGKGAWNSISILLAIWPAIFLYELLVHVKAFPSLCGVVTNSTKDELMTVLMFSWIFSSFLQGISGFGVPVAVCAPMLIAAGVKPLYAVMITLMGHTWANTYGTLGLAWNVLVQQGSLSQHGLAPILTGALLWICNFAGGFMSCWLYGRWKAVRHMLPVLLLISAIQGGGQLATGCIDPTIAAFLPTTIALAAAILLMKAGFYTKAWSMESGMMDRSHGEPAAETAFPVWQAVFPFVLLALISVLIFIVPAVNRPLSQITLSVSMPETATAHGFVNPAQAQFGTLKILTHAGFVLLLSSVFTWVLYAAAGKVGRKDFSPVMAATVRKMVPVSVGIIFLLITAQILRGSGAIEYIAQGVTRVFGSLYGFAAPFVGILGAFVTSSNTSSNILLGSFQASAAELLGLPAAVILSAQTAGGAIGNMLGPSTILLGTTTAGCVGQEGRVLKGLLPCALTLAAIAGAIIFTLGIIL